MPAKCLVLGRKELISLFQETEEIECTPLSPPVHATQAIDEISVGRSMYCSQQIVQEIEEFVGKRRPLITRSLVRLLSLDAAVDRAIVIDIRGVEDAYHCLKLAASVVSGTQTAIVAVRPRHDDGIISRTDAYCAGADYLVDPHEITSTLGKVTKAYRTRQQGEMRSLRNTAAAVFFHGLLMAAAFGCASAAVKHALESITGAKSGMEVRQPDIIEHAESALQNAAKPDQ